MQLVDFSEMLPATWQTQPLDAWSARLKSVCGNFNAQAFGQADTVTGTVRAVSAGGLDIAHVANDLAAVRRDQQDINRDYGENLFLLLQLEGVCGIEQHGRRSIIAPGDCILVDSASPSLFHFGGNFSNHLSIHLPRQIFFSHRSETVEVSRRLGADDPMSVMLHALVAKLLKISAADRRAPHLRELLFNATRQAFAADGEPDLGTAAYDSAAGRIEIVQVLIDRHLTDAELTPQWLAHRLGISLRTLQADFNVLGTTATSLIRTRRLHLARAQLAQMKNAGDGPGTIAEIAYAAGFNDISYFNRCFKKAFDCSPTDVLHQ